MIIFFSSQSANGRSSDRENSTTNHQDAANYRVHPNDQNLQNDRTRDHLWDRSSSSRNPNGISGGGGNDNRMLIGNPNGNSRSGREANGINHNSTGAALARHHATDNPMLVNPTSGMRVTNYSNHRQAVASINGSSRSERETNRIDHNSTGAVSARHRATDNPISMNSIPGTNMDDFTHRLTLATNNILDDSNNADTNDFRHRLEVAANDILDESFTQRR